MVDYALATLHTLSGCEAGLVSLREEGGQVRAAAAARLPDAVAGWLAPRAPLACSQQRGAAAWEQLWHNRSSRLPLQAALESYLAGVQHSPTNEDAVYRAQQLLAALAQLGDI